MERVLSIYGKEAPRMLAVALLLLLLIEETVCLCLRVLFTWVDETRGHCSDHIKL